MPLWSGLGCVVPVWVASHSVYPVHKYSWVVNKMVVTNRLFSPAMEGSNFSGWQCLSVLSGVLGSLYRRAKASPWSPGCPEQLAQTCSLSMMARKCHCQHGRTDTISTAPHKATPWRVKDDWMYTNIPGVRNNFRKVLLLTGIAQCPPILR